MVLSGAAVVHKAKLVVRWLGSEPDTWLAMRTLLVLYVITRLIVDLHRLLTTVTFFLSSRPDERRTFKDCGVQTDHWAIKPALKLPVEILLTAHGHCYHTFVCGAVKRSNGHQPKQLCTICSNANRF